MGIESVIRDDERVANTERKFGEVSEDEGYFPAYRIKLDGTKVPLAFTEHVLDEAEKTAARNMEDMPGEKGFWENLFLG